MVPLAMGGGIVVLVDAAMDREVLDAGVIALTFFLLGDAASFFF